VNDREVSERRKNARKIPAARGADQGVADRESRFGDEKKDIQTCERAHQDGDKQNLRAARSDECAELLVLGMVEERKEKLGTVQRVNWNDVEEHEEEVEEDREKQEDREQIHRRNQAPTHKHPKRDSGCDRHQEIRERTGKRDFYGVPFWISKIVRIVGNRLCPPKPKQQEQDESGRIQVSHGVEGQPAFILGSLIAVKFPHERVRELVDGKREQDGHQPRDRNRRGAEEEVEEHASRPVVS